MGTAAATADARRRGRTPQLHPSELITILVWCHSSHYRRCKAYYTEHAHKHLRPAFPALVSYQRFVELMPTVLMPTVLIPLLASLHQQRGDYTSMSVRESTPLAACRPPRIAH